MLDVGPWEERVRVLGFVRGGSGRQVAWDWGRVVV